MNRRNFLQKSSLALGAAGLGTQVFANEPSLEYFPLDIQPAQGPLNQALPLRYRQVHLDFHTSGKIPGIGSQFDPEAFAQTLKKANVNSVTLFGRCHHGYIYHKTDKFPERRHPFAQYPDLLEQQIEACHKQNIRTPIYVTVQWDEFTAKQHPEWLMRDEDGKPFGNKTFEAGFYQHLCIHTPYLDFLKQQIAEMFEKIPVHGVFLDIHHVYPNANKECLEGMRKLGWDASKREVRLAYYGKVMDEYKKEMTAFIQKLDKNCTVFYNGGHVGPSIRTSINHYTHLELESLPSGGWGYLHFPLTSRYARTLGKDVMGMTGKFHTSWGDFHSLKNQAALEFECFSMLAMNAKCSIGDQLHPSGKLDAATYDLIGKVYAQVAQKEAWCEEAEAIVDIGVLSTEEFPNQSESSRMPEAMMGVVRMLQEGKQQFDVLDSKSDFSAYKVLVLPDHIPLDDILKAKIENYLAKGGSLIASHRSGLNPEGTAFASTMWGLNYKGDAPYSPDFLALNGKGLAAGLPETELVMYLKGSEVSLAGARELIPAHIPFFNRTWEHFSSHAHTPSKGERGYPAVTQNGNVIYFMHPVFTQYAKRAPKWCREVFLNALNTLLPEPAFRLPNSPSSLVASLNEQKKQQRYVLHLLNYIPERRGNEFDVLEDVVTVLDLKAEVRMTARAKSVRTVPQGQSISFSQKSGKLSFTLPKLTGHQMVEIKY